MLHLDLSQLREDYRSEPLDESKMPSDPLLFFKLWFDEAVQAKLPEPNAMTLSTATMANRPSSRVLLLKEVSQGGFVFFTNYRSEKAIELDQNPWAAINFCWLELTRQIRIEGKVTHISPEDSQAYFQSRPRGSQLGAWASPQSQVIPNRHFLETQIQHWTEHFKNTDPIPRPEHWGGFRLIPVMIEFWQGRQNRLHDRVRYLFEEEESGWIMERLAP